MKLKKKRWKKTIKRIRSIFDKKKLKSNIEGWNWKQNSIRKKQKKTNNNKKDEDQIWYKN